ALHDHVRVGVVPVRSGKGRIDRGDVAEVGEAVADEQHPGRLLLPNRRVARCEAQEEQGHKGSPHGQDAQPAHHSAMPPIANRTTQDRCLPRVSTNGSTPDARKVTPMTWSMLDALRPWRPANTSNPAKPNQAT